MKLLEVWKVTHPVCSNLGFGFYFIRLVKSMVQEIYLDIEY